MNGRCGGLAGPHGPEEELCRPGWKLVPEDLRRLLAVTWQAVLDGDPDGPALHEAAHILADEYRGRYHAGVQAARGELAGAREAS